MMFRFLTILFFFVVVTVHAQLNRGGVPCSFNHHRGQLPTVDLVVTPPDMEALAAEDLIHPVPYRFAVNLPVNRMISPQLAVGSEQLADDSIWLFTIHAPGAKAITVYFDRFYIPPGGRLFVYNSEKTILLGAFTDLNNHSSGRFSTALIAGDQVTLEYNQPVETSGIPDLHIAEIAYAYRGVSDLSDKTGFGSSGPCEVNIPCAEADPWQNQQKGIARVAVKKNGATYWCSGSLMNNTRQDKTPYFLSADHCSKGAKPSDYSQWIFYFNYNSPTCEDPPVEPGFRTMVGTEVKSAAGDVNFKGSDFLLLLLNQMIPDTFDVWFNGWNREDIASPFGVGIHHPMGDIKKISTYAEPLISTNWNGHTETTHWQVTWSATPNGHGVTEGGSSGSPIFDADGRVAGTLTGGEALCDSALLNSPDFYGKFSYSWDMNGPDNTQRLSYWLDPDSTGVMVLDGIALTIEEPEMISSELQMYPNPASGILNLKSTHLKEQTGIHINILDSWGRMVASFTQASDRSGHLSIDISSLPNGFYLITLATEELSLTGRIIKL
ncbi:MAG: T9SS type A sorting domain-containing protein [Bacteroidales bacterium]|nr:T9SS type A sorting domain-containing protein [Bacteroidales bacterium]